MKCLDRQTPFIVALMMAIIVGVTGCRTAPKAEPKLDSRVRRLADDGHERYAEGDVDAAMKKFRSAVLRAWAMDDPVESGNGAYNLAACMISDGQTALARDWLADARSELHRGRRSVGNVWLVEAKIATEDARFADATEFLNRAACGEPPCDAADRACGCPTVEGCRDCPLSCLPCVGSKIEAKEATKDCVDGFEAQVHLARARLAAEQFDLATATKHFACACELIHDICSHELHAELQHVAAAIHLAKDETLQAAAHFDLEAERLRSAGNYREIPRALDLAAAAYQQSGLPRQAAERWNRVARIWTGRGEPRKAWDYVRLASEAVDGAAIDSDDCIRIRLSLVAREIEVLLKQGVAPESAVTIGD
ncbi:hypothetical protein Poly51_26220 [Rubripirellula tenax]|uniref:Tetratricopeptide repeat protein n=1 Tax=Rubripirellula tenax TaxID=2528015 RepID=A0A5C6F643_9BACT|nr:hypothetical protein [Rubripirellula tenax]TWU56705.1 hypothetical protein Poly51_26220 [Rubripirellula tenax]